MPTTLDTGLENGDRLDGSWTRDAARAINVTTERVYNPRESAYGATAYAPGTAYASMTDAASAINGAAADAAASGGILIIRGRYRIDSTVTFACNVDATGVEFVVSDTAITAVRVGTTTASTQVQRLRVVLPKIVQAAKTGTGWTGASVGVEIANLNESTVWVPHVKYFTTGILLKTYGTMGIAYNTFHIGRLENNKVNCQLAPTDTNGWTNENLFIGGQYSHETAEGDAVSGTRHILLTGIGTTQPNNNLWVRASLESPDGVGGGSSSVVEYMIESVGGIYNRWLQCRYEGPTPKVYWNQVDSSRYSRENVIDGGYNPEGIVFTVSANSIRNHLRSTAVKTFDGSHANGVSRGSNLTSDSTGLRWYDISTPILTAGADDWRWDWAASQIRVKAKADTVARWSVNTATGTHTWGPGNGAGDTILYRNGANQLKTDDMLIVGSTVGVLRLEPIALPGTCTVGDVCIDTADKKVKVCTATNVWTVVGSQT